MEDVIDGVTLTLNKTTTEATSLSLTQDPSVAKSAIEDFVKAYNGLLGTIKSQTSYDVDAQKSSPLTGDSIARSIQNRMRDAISSGFGVVGNTNLGEIGINTNSKTGELTIDSAKLDKALAEDTEGVKSLFSSDTGISKRVVDMADSFIKSDGMLTTTTTSMEKTVADIKKQFEATGERINQRMDTYRAQFTQLDVMVSQMNTLSSYLTQQLSALSAQK
ncbi:flagellar filament capping protein FliD [Castellaniella sp.]|uniref:flagellar filament capping protein FliD n=1 Tax=Castellaniella sp. TaxID=1955812 RepID=UPI002AFFCCEE|nr:flagellar filament capping protein FliD [Castellaniella sp.]